MLISSEFMNMFLNKKLVDDSILANLKKTQVLTVVLNDDDDVVINEWSVALRYAVLQVDCLFNEINTEHQFPTSQVMNNLSSPNKVNNLSTPLQRP